MPIAEFLRKSLQFLKGVGPRRASDFVRANLLNVEDLLCRLPARYENRGQLAPIASVREGQKRTLVGEVLNCTLRSTRRSGFRIFEVLVGDDSGAIRAVWLNQPFLKDIICVRQRIVLYGLVEARRGGGLQLTNPKYEIVQNETSTEITDDVIEGGMIHTGRIVPVYEKIGVLTPKIQRRLVYDVLRDLPEELSDPLPEEICRRLSLPSRRQAFLLTHFPKNGTSLDLLNEHRTPAQVRMVFEEFFLFQVGLQLRRRQMNLETKTAVIQVNDRIRDSARRVLPFKLTSGQRDALKEIVNDMQRSQPMNRLLQGDVGSGKTIVALLAGLVAIENGLQVVFMAPTEILAEQHELYLRRLLKRSKLQVVALTGSTSTLLRRKVLASIASGEAQFVVGTHALVQENVIFRSLGLVVIDEQHRFGVAQRATLRQKGHHPDVLVMTATPIPRTLSLTAYGDLDVSAIRDVPPGRLPIKTHAHSDSERENIYETVRKELRKGRQAYIIYPLIEESEKIDLKAATEMAKHLSNAVFPEQRVGLLHGRMHQDSKDEVMGGFARGAYDVLVSTSVVEVGVDVPNASVMMIEHAERFGLSQLHQLRGRVGRSSHQSYCYLFYGCPISDQARARLDVLTQTTDGFLIAEQDLRLRGPGDFFGTRQSGMPMFRVGDLLRDQAIMEKAYHEALALMKRGAITPNLEEHSKSIWKERYGLVGVG